eukprot:CAMPEP_0176493338 /NCGR_PEP_ID=MMETSP0200_2-20121128/9497_1 /TAXON_ID=947934 /ORGANISM="Chaetoceros sp., Strain GSL56" /LENGTH=749 /DNA_ID=CAMNT_0017890997 /DNA_START=39 /DNA_END=2288 /DNA_ORIENTATION=+
MKAFTIQTVISCILTSSIYGFGILDSRTITNSQQNSLQLQRLKTATYASYDKQVTKSPRFRQPSNLFSTAINKQQEGIVVGDAKGAVLYIEDVCVSRGSNRIISNVNLRVERGQRWGIVGPNGVGKSTLLGALTGTVRMDEGVALVAPKVDVGYLRQTAVAGSTKTVFEEASSEMKKIQEAKARMEEAEKAIIEGDTSDEMLLKLDEATTDFAAAGGWNQEQTVGNVLKGLGFKPEDMDRLCSEFSGGWQMRIGLARLLLSNPSLLLLDEPSNHLDSSARDWLGKYLKNFDGSLVLVSHDTSLLEASVNNIAEITGGTLLTYVGCSYQKYLEEKEFRAKAAMAEYERNLAEAAKLQSFVDRWGASATKAASAQSRVKMIEKMKKEGKLDAPPAAVVEKRWKPTLVLPPPTKSMGDVLLELKGAAIGHSDEQQLLLQNVDFELRRGMKVILRGPNGAGKSTLMAALRGTLPLLKGERKENEKLRLGYFTQDLAQQLDPSARAIDLVTAYAREGPHGDITVSNEAARNVMGRLGLSADKPLRRIQELSGGEKARVALSMFALKASNVILLDEPSNHLDVECIEALSDALSSWGDGAIIVVSHDKPFCDSVGFNTVGTVMNGNVVVEERDLNEDDWKQYDLSSAEQGAGLDEAGITAKSSKKELTPEEKQLQEQRRKRAFNAPKRILKLEQMIANCETRISEIEKEMMEVATDVEKLTSLTKEKEKEAAKIADMMEEWEELEIVVAEFKKEN